MNSKHCFFHGYYDEDKCPECKIQPITNKCRFCKHRLETARDSNFLGCTKLHNGMNPNEVIGTTSPGYYKNSTGWEFAGHVVTPDSVCPNFEPEK